VELSLEVQGGQDYFRFVEGTCIIACVLSSSVLYIYPLHIDSELTQTLNLRTVIKNVKEEVSKNTIQPPLFVVFLTFTTSATMLLLSLSCCRDKDCRDGGCRVRGRTLRTLSFVNSGEVASDEICF